MLKIKEEKIICYAIKYKNKHTNIKYYSDIEPDLCPVKLSDATLFTSYELAKHYCHSNCKVVKVEIKEIEDGQFD